LSGFTATLTGLELRSGAAVGDVFYPGALTDLGPISTLTNLTELEFSAQPVSTLAPLVNLSQLQQLFMYGDGSTENGGFVGGVTVLSQLTHLQLLDAGYRGITEISSLSALTNLQTVDLNHNPIADISPAAGWNNAKSVILAGVNINGAVPALPGLGAASTPMTLNLSYDGITDIANLSGTPVPGLETAGSVLNLSNNSIPSAQVTPLLTPYPNLSVIYP
jgi:Leucine-rich repeat (LRR) protein